MEIENDPILQRVFWALLIGFFISFIYWAPDKTITIESVEAGLHTCLPYFQNCSDWIFLRTYTGLTPQLLYAILTLSLIGSALLAFSKRWTMAHMFLWPAAIWKVFYLAFIAGKAGTDYEYFHLPILFVFLFSSNKLYFSRVIFALVYLATATAKFDSSWIAGSYFFSLRHGLPLFSDSWIPFITNGVILFEIFSPFALLSKNKQAKTAALVAWIIFHAYSVQIVDFRYPLHCLTMLIALFWETPQAKEIKFNPGQVWSYAIMATFFLLTITPNFIPGDPRYNLKSMKLGVHMFDANHQCSSLLEVVTKNQGTRSIASSSKSAMKRCAPFPIWFRAKQLCARENTDRVSWRFLTSVNGGPFYEAVNSENICSTEYKVFAQNTWFKEPKDGAPIAGYPKKNNFLDAVDLPESQMVFSTPEHTPSSLEQFLLEHERAISTFYWIMWLCAVAVFLKVNLRIRFSAT